MLKRRPDIAAVSADDLQHTRKKARSDDPRFDLGPETPPEPAHDLDDQDSDAFQRRRNLIATAAALDDCDLLRLLLDGVCDDLVESALCRVIDNLGAVECICKTLAETGRRLAVAAEAIYCAASQLRDDTTFVLVARVGSGRRRASIVDALTRLVEDDEPEPIACLFGACARAGSRVSQARRQMWARDALCVAVKNGRPASAEALVHECALDDMAHLLDRFVEANDGDSVAGLLDACDGIVPHLTWTKWATGALRRAAMADKVGVIESLLDMCEPDAVREALLCCADERHRSETFEALWEHADACAHDLVEQLPRGVGRDFLYDLIDEGGGCEGYCKALVDGVDEDQSDTDTDDDNDPNDNTFSSALSHHRRR
ncbi:hypothetical protein pqer_cds_1023 [Pandoravirus quercus]|uniref:Uncharacterized protein n=1 Tax=Pandoravirus quercus TaxID=2107709 RepID=A0A2U7UAN6_9VIRU|nr:hypothetical protein pqer_cds_1023 [Pandoravirus quercus]AVK75445.1 hypothetical protein pqer_cds_1023 [Pandoravirus quercus]